MNEQLKPQQIMKTMQDFERENQKMELKEELSKIEINCELLCVKYMYLVLFESYS